MLRRLTETPLHPGPTEVYLEEFETGMGIGDGNVTGDARLEQVSATAAEEARALDAGLRVPDEIDLARAREYALLATLLLGPPHAPALRRLALLEGGPTPLGRAHAGLGRAATQADETGVRREYFDLFIGVGRGELVPYASYYRAGFVYDRPLLKIREDLARLGLERAGGARDPEDHVGTLCEIMSGLASGRFAAPPSEEARFFGRHLAPFAARFFTDLEGAQAARFYREVGALGRVFMEIEVDGFALGGR